MNSPPVTLVSGSARGLGLACVRRLIQRGDRVHGVWRSTLDPELEPLLGSRWHRADLTEPEQVRRTLDEVLEQDGRLDHLVHAVGEFAMGRLEDLQGSKLRQLLVSNLESAHLVAEASRSALRASGGSLVFFGLAGLSGLRARRTSAAYAAAKSALLVFARSLAVEEGPYGVRVNVVSPGVIPHPAAHADTLNEDHVASIPLGRVGRPEDVAEAVEFLTSPRASYITGADLPVAGGWLL